MTDHTKIAVLGGAGRTGKFLVNELLRSGYSIKLLLRKPEDFPLQNTNIEIVKGDALDEIAICELLSGCQAVINTISQRKGEPLVAFIATELVLHAMTAFHISRYIVLAGLNIDVPSDKKSPQTAAATTWMKTNFPEIQKDRQLAYQLLAENRVNWTLVRVPMIEFTEKKSEIETGLFDCKGTSISAASLGEFLVDILHNKTYFCRAPFVWSK